MYLIMQFKVLKSYFIENKWKFRMCEAKSKEKLILKLVKVERLGKLFNIKIYLFILTFLFTCLSAYYVFLKFCMPIFFSFNSLGIMSTQS